MANGTDGGYSPAAAEKPVTSLGERSDRDAKLVAFFSPGGSVRPATNIVNPSRPTASAQGARKVALTIAANTVSAKPTVIKRPWAK